MNASLLRPASVARWHEQPPQVEGAGARSWIARGANFVVVFTQAAPGTRLERRGQADE